MKLVIVESPTKVKTISKYLGEDYKVMASYGHIRDLASFGYHNLGVDIDNNFAPTYEITARGFTVSKIKKVAEEAEQVYLATDPDREGEAISWHLAQVLNLDLATTPRLEFNEITPYGIDNALANPRIVNMSLVHSQETRRIVDRIIGYELSTLLKKKINMQSAGRVQSAVLKIICDREAEINSFKADEYWNIYATIKDGDFKHEARLVKINGEDVKLINEDKVKEYLSKLSKTMKVVEIKEEEKDYYPAPPFTTSALQQEAFNVLGFPAKKTMQLAQELYEGVKTSKGLSGVITYMRTDSYRLSPLFIASAKKEIEATYGPEFVGKAYAQKSDKKVQDGHEGIRPTYIDNKPEELKEYLSNDQYRLYNLIYRRAIASMMTPRHQTNVTVTLKAGNDEFTLEGSIYNFIGFSKAYNVHKKAFLDMQYNFKKNDELEIIDTRSEQEFTKPPFRYNEARLVRTMEELGIGRPSTYVQTIETLKKRAYIKEEKNGAIFATDDGMKTTSNLQEFFATLVDSQYTAALELQLDMIAEDKQQELDLLSEFSEEFYTQLKYAEENMKEEEAKVLDELCPECGHPLVVKKNRRNGEEFIGCSNYPNCHYIKPSATKHLEGEGEICPECGKGHLVSKKGRYGYFLACDQYPKCSYTKNVTLSRFKKKIFSSKKDSKK